MLQACQCTRREAAHIVGRPTSGPHCHRSVQYARPAAASCRTWPEAAVSSAVLAPPHPFASGLHSLRSTPGPGRRTQRGLVTLMGNKQEGGVFSPLVVVVRQAVGQSKFNQFRGKAISLHSQVIKSFCKNIGADQKQIQGLIRLAKQNGGRLGFLA